MPRDYEIKDGKIVIAPKFKEDKLIFDADLRGPDYYAEVMGQIRTEELLPSNFIQTISLLNAAYKHPEESKFKEIISLFENNWFWAATGVFNDSRGVYFQDIPELIDGRIFMEGADLAKKIENGFKHENILYSPDCSLRFIPHGFMVENPARGLEKSLYVAGLAGGWKQAELVAQFAKRFECGPWIWGEKPTIENARVCALSGDHCGSRLMISAYSHLTSGKDYAFARTD